MISVTKFLKLEPRIRVRKLWRLLYAYESDIRAVAVTERPGTGLTSVASADRRQKPKGSGKVYSAGTLNETESHRFFVELCSKTSWAEILERDLAGFPEIIVTEKSIDDKSEQRIDQRAVDAAGVHNVCEQFSRSVLRVKVDRNELQDGSLLRSTNSLRHLVMRFVGKEAAEWDLFPPLETGVIHESLSLAIDTAPCMNLYCDDIRSPFNIGSIFRTASAFGFSKIYLSQACPSPYHPRALRSSMGAVEHLAWSIGSIDEAISQVTEETDANTDRKISLFALEQGGIPIEKFSFPSRGLAVIGSEELGVSPEILALCKKSAGIVSIELPGPKSSLNVAGAFAIMANYWVLSRKIH